MKKRHLRNMKRWIGWILAVVVIATSGNMPAVVWADEFSDGTDIGISENKNVSDSEEIFTDTEDESSEDIQKNSLSKKEEEDSEAVVEEPTDVLAARASNPFSKGQCTWYAYKRWTELLGYAPAVINGNAGGWYNNCVSKGFSRGNEPKVGAIACWNNGFGNDSGHVAVVEAVYSDHITISEYNWNIKEGYEENQLYFNKIDRRSSSKPNRHLMGYIYLPGTPSVKPSYKDFSVSQSVYSLHDIIEFKVKPINATGIGISIDKEGVGRVVAGDCNRTDGHTLWGINLGVGKYSAHITVYNGSKWVDTNDVYFSVVPPEYSNLSVSKEKYGTNEDIQFNINTSHTERMTIGIDREGEGRVYTESCGNSVNGWSVPAGKLGEGKYTAYFSLYSTNDYWLDTEKVSFSVYDPETAPSYSDFSISKSVYSLHDIIEFKVNPINATSIGISIDKEGIGRVVAGDCNRTDGHTLWGINLGVGKYSAHITVYNGSKWVDTNDVYFSVVPPEYSNLSVSKEKYGTNEDIQFNINTSHTERMTIGIDREGEGRVYTESCGNSVNGWSVPAGKLGEGKYTAYFSLYSTNDYWLDTEKVSFSVYDPETAPSYSDFSISKSVYSLHDIIEFKVNPINATSIGISIDKEGIGRVVAGDCNRTDGHTLWGINLGVGKYSAHITVYNGSKWVDTNDVYFSVVPPEYSNLSVSKEKYGTNEDIQFNINTSHTERMTIGIDREGEGRVYTEPCGDSVNGWSIPAKKLGTGKYTAYFSLYSTNDYWLDTETVSFSVVAPEPLSVSLKMERNSVVAGESVRLYAQTQGGTGKYTYKFIICDAKGNWFKLRDYGEDNTYIWIPGVSGKKTLYVDVKDDSGKVKRAELSCEVINKMETLTVKLTADPSSSVVSGKTVKLTASANGGTEKYTYKFLVCDAKGNWYKIRDFGSINTCTWIPGAAGKKTLYVDVKDSAGTVKRAEISYEVAKKVEPLTAKFIVEPSVSAVSGKTVKLTASGNGGTGKYTYKFLVCDAKGNWYRIRDFESSNTCTWTPGAAGKKTLYVDVKDSAGTVKRAELSYEVEKKVEALTAKLTADPSSSVVSGKTVKLTASATGGSGKYTYKFLVCDAKGNWYRIRDFESSNTCTWIPGAAGKKTLYVDVKDSAGTVKRTEVPYEVKTK